MNDYIRQTFGDPCRECGYTWDLEADAARAIVRELPTQVDLTLRGRQGTERTPDLSWNATAYVCHLADNLRIWAERVAGASLGSTEPIASYDEDALGVARDYGHIPLVAARWSLERAVNDWSEARSLEPQLPLQHPFLGELGAATVERIMGHEAVHHLADLRRIANSST
jgi:hypothetical protein